jgi:hypothetical protein
MARRSVKPAKRASGISETDRLAQRAAAAIAKGQSPNRSDELEDYFHRSPRDIFAALDGAVANMPATADHKPLAYGYLFILEGLLVHLRYRIDRGYADAIDLVAEFQAALAARIRDRSIDGPMLGLVVGVLQQAGIAAAPELVEASAALSEQSTRSVVEADLDATMVEMVAACGGDPFALAASGAEACHAMPEEARSAMVTAFASGDHPVARSAAVLFLLDPSPGTRMAVAAALARVCAALSPTDVRRLIAMREWRPEQERAAIDALVRRAREAGIAAAPWPAGSAEEILASAVDGAASQGLVIVSPSGRKKRIASILVKDGIADAFVGDEKSRRQTDATITRAAVEGQMAPVSRGYLDGVVSHYLATLVARGTVPPVGLLEVAEAMGGADWQPVRLEFEAVLADLLASIPKAMLAPEAVRAILRRSGQLADLIQVADSWFEDDADISRTFAGSRGAGREKRAEYLLQTGFHQRRGKWADLFLRTAVWLREVDETDRRHCFELAIVAKAVAEGGTLAEIGLMRRIALQTVDFLEANRRRDWF